MTGAGMMYRRLVQAVARRGSARSVYSQDTTLSRRGLLTRADRRARELSALGVAPGQLVALSMGNVVELLVGLLAVSKIGAVAAVVDAGAGDKPLLALASRLPIRAVIRRPRGAALSAVPRSPAANKDTGRVDYPDTYRVVSRRRLAASLLSVDVLQPAETMPTLPPATEMVIEARGIGGTVRDVAMDGASLAAAGLASASALSIDEGSRLLTTQPLTIPRFFIPVILGWLSSEAQLVMAEGSALGVAKTFERLIVVESVRHLIGMARAIKTGGGPLTLAPVVVAATAPTGLGRTFKAAFGDAGRQVLLLEELGVLAHRPLSRHATFVPAHGVALSPGAAMQIGGHELLAQTAHTVAAVPDIPATHPGAVADAPFRHTGYAGRFNKADALSRVLGRDDGLVALEGRRACLDQVEDALLTHRRLTWARAFVESTDDGEPMLRVEYRATGQTDVDDLEEHALDVLPPYMVPRALLRLPS